jgi:hypothetical protein
MHDLFEILRYAQDTILLKNMIFQQNLIMKGNSGHPFAALLGNDRSP